MLNITFQTLVLLTAIFCAGSAQAGTLTWDPNGNSTDGSGTWGVTTPANWWNGTSHSQNYLNATPFTDAVFGWNSGTAE